MLPTSHFPWCSLCLSFLRSSLQLCWFCIEAIQYLVSVSCIRLYQIAVTSFYTMTLQLNSGIVWSRLCPAYHACLFRLIKIVTGKGTKLSKENFELVSERKVDVLFGNQSLHIPPIFCDFLEACRWNFVCTRLRACDWLETKSLHLSMLPVLWMLLVVRCI